VDDKVARGAAATKSHIGNRGRRGDKLVLTQLSCMSVVTAVENVGCLLWCGMAYVSVSFN